MKGFELKRRGELELIKTFQSQVFERFLDGGSLKDCYESVAEIANHWIDVLDTQGESLDDDEVIDLISENRSMSRQLEDYGDQKGTSQTTARRLGEFLGSEIIKDKGLNCKFIIAEQPYGAPVTERAIPTAIWKAEPAVMRHYLRKWLKSPGMEGDACDIRNVLDWDYYKDRLGKTIQKIITIPAALQKVSNPVPRIPHPVWLSKKISQMNDRFQQKSILSMFQPKQLISSTTNDIEDIGRATKVAKRPIVRSRKSLPKSAILNDKDATGEPEEKEDRVELSQTNFSAWLKQKKYLWRRKRKELQGTATNSREGKYGSESVNKRRKTALTMEGFVREAATTLTANEWHVIEIHEKSYQDSSPGSSGEMVMWIMVGKETLQKVHVSIPRIVYVSSHKELTNTSKDIEGFKRVDKNLPHGKIAAFVYEVTMPEYVFRDKKWIKGLKPIDVNLDREDCLQSIFETGTPLIARALHELGCVSRLKPSVSKEARSKKAYSLLELNRVERPLEGEYLHHATFSFKRMFLYLRLHPRTKTGLVALFMMDVGSGRFRGSSDDTEERPCDITRPMQGPASSLDVSATCHLWIVKPGSARTQKNVAVKHCEGMFTGLLQTIQESGEGVDNDYACVSPNSSCRFKSLKFVDNESDAYSGANDVINGYRAGGPTLLFVNSSKPTGQLRRDMGTINSVPVVPMPFPPGPAHNPSISTLPALNWEQPAIHLGLEAYLYMNVVCWPNRVSYARYGNVPIGNLGEDENMALYDVGLSRLIQKNRTLSWGSPIPGHSDSGLDFVAGSGEGSFPDIESCGQLTNQEDIWCDDDELISPVIRRQGESFQ